MKGGYRYGAGRPASRPQTGWAAQVDVRKLVREGHDAPAVNDRLQRERRSTMVRIDYMPAAEAVAIIEAKRAELRPGSVEATNGAILDAILREWAKLTGLKWKPIDRPKSPAGHTGINGPLRTHARMTPAATPQEHGKARGGALKVWTDSVCRPAVHPCILAKSK